MTPCAANFGLSAMMLTRSSSLIVEVPPYKRSTSSGSTENGGPVLEWLRVLEGDQQACGVPAGISLANDSA